MGHEPHRPKQTRGPRIINIIFDIMAIAVAFVIVVTSMPASLSASFRTYASLDSSGRRECAAAGAAAHSGRPLESMLAA